MAYDNLTTSPLDLEAFNQRLARHDWSYNYSDCHAVWEAGSREQGALRIIASQSAAHTELFEAFRAWAFGDGPKPELPATGSLSNVSDEELADQIGAAAAKAREANTELERLKEEAKGRKIEHAEGQHFVLTIAVAERLSLDTSAIKKEMPPAWVLAHLKSSTCTTVSVKSRQ